VGQPQQQADHFNQSRPHAGAFRLHYLGSHPATRFMPNRHADRRAVSERVGDHSRKVCCRLRVVVRSLKSLRPPQDTSSQHNPFSRSTLLDPLTQRQASWGWWYPWSFWRDGSGWCSPGTGRRGGGEGKDTVIRSGGAGGRDVAYNA
jgi:hypothetical protein